MKNNTNSFTLIILVSFLLMLTTSLSGKDSTDELVKPEIRSGIAKIEGQIYNYKSKIGDKGLTICVRFNNMVTGEDVIIESKVNESKKFMMDVPLERSVALVSLNISTDMNANSWRVIGLNQDKCLQLTIVFKDSTDFEISGKGGLGISNDDMLNIITATSRFDEFNTWDDYSKMTPEVFFEKARHGELTKRMDFAMDSLIFSKQIKGFLMDEFTLHFLKGRVLVYKIAADLDFSSNGTKMFYSDFSAAEPDLATYSFLKEYDLNNPKHLYSFYYSDFLSRFLSISAFKIPIISDTNVDDWLNVVKKSIKDVVGFDSGLFYDMLVAKAYSLQLVEEHSPFSERQVENINKYFSAKNANFVKILMKSNDDLTSLIEHNNDLKICEVPLVNKELLLDSIISRYKGHVVLVDFWATWCGPCLDAHKSMKSLKNDLKDKGVKFVYFTTISSPKPLWDGKIKEIGGEQYYLSNESWEYLLDTFGFKGIPSYLIIDKEGVVKQKFTGFQGVDRMKEMLEKLNN